MNAMRGWFFGAATEDMPVDSGQAVYPVHVLDRMKEYQTFVARVMLFNDVLDADLLSASLSRLLEIGDWRKLGGRLQKDVSYYYLAKVNRQKKSFADPLCSYPSLPFRTTAGLRCTCRESFAVISPP